MRYPLFIINAKNYKEASGERLHRFLEYAAIIEKKTSVKIYIAPSLIDIYYYSGDFSNYIISQYADTLDYGSSTGHIPIKRLIDIGVKASLLNHSEYKVPHEMIKRLVDYGNRNNFNFIVCVDSIKELGDLLKMGVKPAAYAIEPPELIGSGRSVSKYKPDIVREAVDLGYKNDIPILCGAGIVDEEDVKIAVELGVKGILVASGIIKDDKPFEKMLKMADELKNVR